MRAVVVQLLVAAGRPISAQKSPFGRAVQNTFLLPRSCPFVAPSDRTKNLLMGTARAGRFGTSYQHQDDDQGRGGA